MGRPKIAVKTLWGGKYKQPKSGEEGGVLSTQRMRKSKRKETVEKGGPSRKLVGGRGPRKRVGRLRQALAFSKKTATEIERQSKKKVGKKNNRKESKSPGPLPDDNHQH